MKNPFIHLIPEVIIQFSGDGITPYGPECPVVLPGKRIVGSVKD